LGVGFAIRRGIPETLQRLGLRLPTRQDMGWGIGIGILAMIVVPVLLLLWSSVTSPEAFQAQTEAVAELDAAIVSLPLAFVVAISAALGEEIWMRGGLQPVFGNVITSVFFSLEI
jgi:membrane protease YdiL (CAAX protease family)